MTRPLSGKVLLLLPLTPILNAQVINAQYVGSAACRTCHPAQYDKQANTGHADALALAPPGSPGQWAFGAGAKAIAYVSQLDRDWYIERGVSYYAAAKSMAPTPGRRDGADLRYRTFDPSASILRCFRYHSTGPLSLGAGHRVEPSEPGVHCESCHGPGSVHVTSRGAVSDSSACARRPRSRRVLLGVVPHDRLYGAIAF